MKSNSTTPFSLAKNGRNTSEKVSDNKAEARAPSSREKFC
jgi:hypothetical protein